MKEEESVTPEISQVPEYGIPASEPQQVDEDLENRVPASEFTPVETDLNNVDIDTAEDITQEILDVPVDEIKKARGESKESELGGPAVKKIKRRPRTEEARHAQIETQEVAAIAGQSQALDKIAKSDKEAAAAKANYLRAGNNFLAQNELKKRNILERKRSILNEYAKKRAELANSLITRHTNPIDPFRIFKNKSTEDRIALALSFFGYSMAKGTESAFKVLHKLMDYDILQQKYEYDAIKQYNQNVRAKMKPLDTMYKHFMDLLGDEAKAVEESKKTGITIIKNNVDMVGAINDLTTAIPNAEITKAKLEQEFLAREKKTSIDEGYNIPRGLVDRSQMKGNTMWELSVPFIYQDNKYVIAKSANEAKEATNEVIKTESIRGMLKKLQAYSKESGFSPAKLAKANAIWAQIIIQYKVLQGFGAALTAPELSIIYEEIPKPMPWNFFKKYKYDEVYKGMTERMNKKYYQLDNSLHNLGVRFNPL